MEQHSSEQLVPNQAAGTSDVNDTDTQSSAEEADSSWRSRFTLRHLRLAPRIFIANSALLIITILATSITLLVNSSTSLRDQTSDNAEQLARLIAGKYGDIGEISLASVAKTVDVILDDPMTAQAAIAAYLVEAAEAAGYDTSSVIDILTSIASETVLDEFWITDTTAYAYLTNVRYSEGELEGELIYFAFDPDPSNQPQAHKFYPLLHAPPDSFAVVTQPAQVREVDQKTFKYVGVSGTDHNRIVQVGNELVFGNQELLRQSYASERADVSAVIEGNLGQHMRVEGTILDHFIEAAEAADWGKDSIEAVFATLVDRTNIGEIRVATLDGRIVYTSIPTDDRPFLPQVDTLRSLDLLRQQWVDHPTRSDNEHGTAYKYVTVARQHGKRIVQVGLAIESASGNVLYTVYQDEANFLVREGYPQALWIVNQDNNLAAAAQSEPLLYLGGGDLSAFVAFDSLMAESSAARVALDSAMAPGNQDVIRVARLGLLDPEQRGTWAASPVNIGEQRIGGVLFFVNMDEIANNVWGEARQTALIAILLLAFTAAATYFGTQLLTRPIGKIADAARMVESGEQLDYDLIRPVMQRSDEIGSLARVFEDMAIQVFNREEVLEALVSERTLALQTTNAELRQAQRVITRDLEMAKVVQAALVREGTVDFKGFTVCARMEPALRVGGDFVDFVEFTPGHLFVVVGDVSGKGVASALFMAASQAALKYAVAEGVGTISDIAEEANRRLCSQNPMDLFVTVILAIVELSTGMIEYVSAGHEPPYILAPDGSRNNLPMTGGLAMGVLDDFPYESKTMQFMPGETLVMYSDGLTDMVNMSGELFGKNRLETSIDDAGSRLPQDIVDKVWSDILTFSVGTAPADDMTCLVLHHKTDNGRASEV